MGGKSETNHFTPKQLHFCRCVTIGMTQAAAYRVAYLHFVSWQEFLFSAESISNKISLQIS
jgi:hypothetical protein